MSHNTQTAVGWISLALSKQISPKVFLKINVPSGTEIENLLVDAIKNILSKGHEISAENIWLETKSQPILGCYMNIANQIDGRSLFSVNKKAPPLKEGHV